MQGTTTRKLIDIKMSVFETLSRKARLKGVSLKRYIEDLLEEDSLNGDNPVPEGVTDEKIISLIGIAKPSVPLDWIEDERLQYILSK
ncbi:MAG: hypothetical protein IKI89_06985 [Bacteroidales bacterium]|nr:hypothetical protein [Bacteroidales bacterium]